MFPSQSLAITLARAHKGIAYAFAGLKKKGGIHWSGNTINMMVNHVIKKHLKTDLNWVKISWDNI